MFKMKMMLTLLLCTFFINCAAPLKYSHPTKKSLENYNNLYLSPVQSDIVGQVNHDILNEIVVKASVKIKEENLFENFIQHAYSPYGETQIQIDSVYNTIFKLNGHTAELSIRVNRYKKQNSFLLFLFGFLGHGHVGLDLRLIDIKSKELLSQAETEASITDWRHGERQVTTPLALAINNFINECFNELKEYRKVNMVNTNTKFIKDDNAIEDLPLGYSEVELFDGRVFVGEIRKVNDEKCYLEAGKTLYIIRTKLIKTILKDEKTLSLSDLQNQKWNRINFNSYKKREEIK